VRPGHRRPRFRETGPGSGSQVLRPSAVARPPPGRGDHRPGCGLPTGPRRAAPCRPHLDARRKPRPVDAGGMSTWRAPVPAFFETPVDPETRLPGWLRNMSRSCWFFLESPSVSVTLDRIAGLYVSDVGDRSLVGGLLRMATTQG